MLTFTNAKLNLGLNIIRRREDGYHDLSTIFFPVGTHSGCPDNPGRIADIIEITLSPTAEDRLNLSGNKVDCAPEKNLVWKALQAFRTERPDLPAVEISLEKHVPDGAGMGGGSADASFTLRSLNEFVTNPLDIYELSALALRLGADCPFFILNRPAIGEGIGEILTPVDLSLRDYTAVILKPKEGISTAQAFSMITPSAPAYSPRELLQMPPEEWQGKMVNDFEVPMFAIHPALRGIKDYLYERGAAYASMTGSGSAFFGLFRDSEAAHKAVVDSPVPFAAVLTLD